MPSKCSICGNEFFCDRMCRMMKEEAANHRAHRDALMETLGIDIDKVVPKKVADPPETIPDEPEPPYSDLDELDLQHDVGVRRDHFSGELHLEGMP